MPRLEEREHARTSLRLADWLAGKLGPAAEPELLSIDTPPGSGFSGETLLVTARWTDAGRRADRPLVVRCEPRQLRVVADTYLERQVRVLQALAEHSRLPVPRVLWYEPDRTVLGTPFFVVDRLPGRTPTDQPPYHEAGWFAEAVPAQRTAMWWNALTTLAEVHAVPPGTTGVPMAGDLLSRHLEMLELQRDWMPRVRLPLLDEAAGWLWTNRPAAHDAPVLLWGDARLGNLLFSGEQVTGVLDWEKVMAGPREFDLAWFLYVDRHHSEGCRLPRLTGLPTPAETIARYESLTGHQMLDMAYFQVLASYQFALLMISAVSSLISLGRLPAEVGTDYITRNSGTAMLRVTLTEAGG